MAPRVEMPDPVSADDAVRLRLRMPGTGYTGDTELLYRNINMMLLRLGLQNLLTDIELNVGKGAFKKLELDGETGSQCVVAFGVTMDKKPNIRRGEVDLLVKRNVLENIETNLDFDFTNPFDP